MAKRIPRDKIRRTPEERQKYLEFRNLPKLLSLGLSAQKIKRMIVRDGVLTAMIDEASVAKLDLPEILSDREVARVRKAMKLFRAYIEEGKKIKEMMSREDGKKVSMVAIHTELTYAAWIALHFNLLRPVGYQEKKPESSPELLARSMPR